MGSSALVFNRSFSSKVPVISIFTGSLLVSEDESEDGVISSISNSRNLFQLPSNRLKYDELRVTNFSPLFAVIIEPFFSVTS